MWRGASIPPLVQSIVTIDFLWGKCEYAGREELPSKGQSVRSLQAFKMCALDTMTVNVVTTPKIGLRKGNDVHRRRHRKSGSSNLLLEFGLIYVGSAIYHTHEHTHMKKVLFGSWRWSNKDAKKIGHIYQIGPRWCPTLIFLRNTLVERS
jgi:hypothetical protein